MKSRLKKILKSLGPGFITGAADDDPSGIGTYSQTGAQFGYSQLWTAPFSFPFMTTVQEMCGRIGLVTGKGLSANIRLHYSKRILYFAVLILFIANTVNIGANLGAMASAGQLVLGIPFLYWLLFLTVMTVLLQVFVPYRVYSKFLKYLTFSLFAYVVTVFVVKQNWSEIAVSTFVPNFTFSKEYLLNIVAILGTTISPYLFFWEASEEVEEEIEHHKVGRLGKAAPVISAKDISKMRTDTVIGMFFSNLVMFFIIVTTASTLNANGITSIQTADQAAEALRPFAGDFAFILFALGIIGTGLLSVPVLSGSASYAISEAFNWKNGLYRKFKQAHKFYGIIAISTVIGLLINFTPIEPFQLLYYTAVLNGVCAPPLLILIMRMSNNKNILGEYVNGRVSNILGWTITALMSIASVSLIVSFFI
jgi:NRAMP (natural resistance-associated macrophage protein)-like metal ion transporter